MQYAQILEARSRPISGLQVDAAFVEKILHKLADNFENLPEHTKFALYNVALEYSKNLPTGQKIRASELSQILGVRVKFEHSDGYFEVLKSMVDGYSIWTTADEYIGELAKVNGIYYFKNQLKSRTGQHYAKSLNELAKPMLDNVGAIVSASDRKRFAGVHSIYVYKSGRCEIKLHANEQLMSFDSTDDAYKYFREHAHRNDL